MTAWTDDQLAAFTSGELDVAEADALEVAIADDPALAARVERIRRVDALLTGLPTPVPTASFGERMRLATDEAVAEVVGDELAARRQRRAGGSPATRWVLGGAAAALVAVAGVAAIGGGLLGGADEDSAEVAMDGTGLRTGEMQDEAMTESDDSAAAGQSTLAFGADLTPVLADDGESFDDARLDQLAADVRGRVGVPDPGTVSAAADANTLAFGAAPSAAGGVAPAPPAEADEQEQTESLQTESEAATDTSETSMSTTMAPALQVVGDVSDDDRERVAACLEAVLAGSDDLGQQVVPVEARLGTRDGEEVVVLVLLGRDPTTDTFTRVETWVTARDTCEVREYLQS